MSSGKPRDVEVTFQIQGLGKDLHVLNFQADTGLDPDGKVGPNTRSKLKSEFGE